MLDIVLSGYFLRNESSLLQHFTLYLCTFGFYRHCFQRRQIKPGDRKEKKNRTASESTTKAVLCDLEMSCWQCEYQGHRRNERTIVNCQT